MNENRHPDRGQNLRDLVSVTLARNPYLAGRTLRIDVHENDVILSGVVQTYYQKQMAQESIRSTEGVRRVHNEIEVVSV